MTHPIPLSAPDGALYAFACGACHRVHAPTRQDKAAPAVEHLAHPQAMAETCCTCRRCGAQTPSPLDWVCEACRPAQEAEDQERQRKMRIELDNEEHACRESLKAAKDYNAAVLLRQVMSEVSEDLWSAGWLVELEYLLWDAMQGGARLAQFDGSEIPTRTLGRMEELCQQAGGWWYADGEKSIETFISLTAWLDRFDRHRWRSVPHHILCPTNEPPPSSQE